MTNVQDIPAPLLAMIGDAKATVSPEHIKQVLDIYGQRLRSGDVDGIMALYAPDAVLQDPIVAPARTGDAIRAFFAGAVEGMGGLDMRLDGAVRVSGNYGAASYLVHVPLEDGRHLYIDTLDVMLFNDDGLIVSQQAYWSASNISIEASARASA